ncbi:MAG: hypothetical protein C4291_08340 [Candidatus Dadabacteria bacterium]
MLDIIDTLVLATIFVVDVIAIVGFAPLRPAIKLIAFVIAAAWSAMIVAVAAMDGFAPGVTGHFPAPVLAFGVLVIGGIAAWLLSSAFRNAPLSLPLAALVGINAFRVGGIFFLILFAKGRLSAPFASSAG